MKAETRVFLKVLCESLLEYRLNEDHVYICRDMGNDFKAMHPDYDMVAHMEACGYKVTENLHILEDTAEREEGYYQLTLEPTKEDTAKSAMTNRTYLMRLRRPNYES